MKHTAATDLSVPILCSMIVTKPMVYAPKIFRLIGALVRGSIQEMEGDAKVYKHLESYETEILQSTLQLI